MIYGYLFWGSWIVTAVVLGSVSSVVAGVIGVLSFYVAQRIILSNRNLAFTLQEWVGSMLYRLRLTPKWSTGIHGGTTAGYGKLDTNGYWQFPAWQAIIDQDKRLDTDL